MGGIIKSCYIGGVNYYRIDFCKLVIEIRLVVDWSEKFLTLECQQNVLKLKLTRKKKAQ